MVQHQPNQDAVRDHEQPLRLHVERADQGLQIFRTGTKSPALTQHARLDHRPFIHPILAPDGVGG